ncbi:hypothetical protein ACNKHW_05815 [Shigella flexneri]
MNQRNCSRTNLAGFWQVSYAGQRSIDGVMMSPPHLSLADARNLHLAAQGLLNKPRR